MVGKTDTESDRGEDGITSVQSQSDLKFIFNSLILLAVSHFPDVAVMHLDYLILNQTITMT